MPSIQDIALNLENNRFLIQDHITVFDTIKNSMKKIKKLKKFELNI